MPAGRGCDAGGQGPEDDLRANGDVQGIPIVLRCEKRRLSTLPYTGLVQTDNTS